MKKDDERDVEGQLQYLANVRDEDIDYSDIPEIKSMKNAIRGRFYQPGEGRIALGIDEDIVMWFRARGADYQDEINNVLREYAAKNSGAYTPPV